MICLILATLFSESVYQYQRLSANEQLNDYRDSLGRLSRLGDFVENHIEQPSRFIAPTTLMNYLPGLSSKSKVVFLRNTAWAPYPVDLNEVTEFFSNNSGITLERQIQILDKYNVQYILTESDDLKDNYARNSNLFSIQGFDEYWIVNFKK